MLRRSLCVLLVACGTPLAWADGPADNIPETVRAVPPAGAQLAPADQEKLEAGLKKIEANLATLRSSKDARIQSLLPDVEIYQRAIRDGLAHREFYPAEKPDQAAKIALQVMDQGIERSEQLLKGNAPWLRQSGLVVRGYRSRIDKTAQPYGLVIPPTYSFDGAEEHRMDLWFHGRGETLSESAFIQQRMTQLGPINPTNTIVLHPYGRYCNANKFAGEVDSLEALDHAKQFYRINLDKIAVRGFSMGGAACWQFAVHYPDRWFAANPGAGFSETPEFLKVFQKETLGPTWFERKLWHYYDCTDSAMNLFHLPTVAYSGDQDSQKQAADIMEQYLAKEGLKLTHVIGPNTKHAIHPESKKIIDDKLDSIARAGRRTTPSVLNFVTYTLKYNRMHWLTVTGMGEHWEQARVHGEITGNKIALKTQNVTSLKLDFAPGTSPFLATAPVTIEIDGAALAGDRPSTEVSWTADLVRDKDAWKLGAPAAGLRKQHDLQGPIDDAFMDAFIVVKPTGTAKHELVEKWTRSEFTHCVEHWRKHYRGDAIVKDDTAITDDDIKSANLVIFGDATSNAVLKRLADQLPVKWTESAVSVGTQSFAATDHAPVMIYPNPLNPKRYVVLNSGFTFREFAYLNNARQVPKLPDWAIVDLKTKPNPLWPGKIVAADFFGEQWEVRPVRP